jgi:hypothetical protein
VNLLGSDQLHDRVQTVLDRGEFAAHDSAQGERVPLASLIGAVDVDDYLDPEDSDSLVSGLPEVRDAFVPFVALAWAPVNDFHASDIPEGELRGPLYTRKVDFAQGSLLIPDEDDPTPRVLAELSSESRFSVMSLTVSSGTIAAVSLFRSHCGTVTAGCPKRRTGCDCTVEKVPTTRGGETWQCRCSRHHVP